MDFVQLLALAVLQGFTEFLPISSSGHLILLPVVFGWSDQGLAFDIAVHLGTLAAVVVYFKRELLGMVRSLGAPASTEGRFALCILIASIPLALAGALFATYVATHLRLPIVIAVESAGFGVALWAADRYRRGARDEHSLRWREALFIGATQALALVPGTSRAGITMMAGLALGLSREAAGRFSFFLAVPATAMAVVWQLAQLATSGDGAPWGALALAALLAAIVAYATIAMFLRLIGRIGMGVFAAYRIVLAAVIVYYLL